MNHSMSLSQKKEIESLYVKGVLIAKIARKTQIPQQEISNYLSKVGLIRIVEKSQKYKKAQPEKIIISKPIGLGGVVEEERICINCKKRCMRFNMVRAGRK